MKVEIEMIYYDWNHDIHVLIKCIEPESPPYNQVCVLSDNDRRRHINAKEKYRRELKKYEEELKHFYLGEAEITQEEK
jgi:hypothetical protein